jgi:hypothetical protein
MPAPKTSAYGPVAGLLSVVLLLSVASASPASACSGGIAFDWAVARAEGGILESRVVSARVRADFSVDLEIARPKVVSGDPPIDQRVQAVAGDPCEQTADPGESIVLLFGVRDAAGDPPLPAGALRLPLFYVIEGRDSLEPPVVAAAVGRIPATDHATVEPAPNEGSPLPLLGAVMAVALGLLVTLRRTERL